MDPAQAPALPRSPTNPATDPVIPSTLSLPAAQLAGIHTTDPAPHVDLVDRTSTWKPQSTRQNLEYPSISDDFINAFDAVTTSRRRKTMFRSPASATYDEL